MCFTMRIENCGTDITGRRHYSHCVESTDDLLIVENWYKMISKDLLHMVELRLALIKKNLFG